MAQLKSQPFAIFRSMLSVAFALISVLCFIFQALRTISRSIVGRTLIANRFSFFVMLPFSFRFIRKRKNTHRPTTSPPSVKSRCLRLRLVGRNAEVFRCNSQKCTIPGKQPSPAGDCAFSNVLSTIVLHYKRQAIPQLLAMAPRHPSPGTGPEDLQPL